MNWRDRIKAQEAIGKALTMADLIMERDGIQALRGKAWTDTDREIITEGVKAFERMHGVERN